MTRLRRSDGFGTRFFHRIDIRFLFVRRATEEDRHLTVADLGCIFLRSIGWEPAIYEHPDERETHQPEHGHLEGDDETLRYREDRLPSNQQGIEIRNPVNEEDAEGH